MFTKSAGFGCSVTKRILLFSANTHILQIIRIRESEIKISLLDLCPLTSPNTWDVGLP